MAQHTSTQSPTTNHPASPIDITIVMQTNNIEDEAPTTPPNIPDTYSNPHGPQSIRRESSRQRTPSHRPGFIPTSNDSRRSFIAPVDKTRKSKPAVPCTTLIDCEDLESESTRSNRINLGTQLKHRDGRVAVTEVRQTASRTGKVVQVDTIQDSDEDNAKAEAIKNKERTLLLDKDGFDHPKLYFYPRGQGPKQVFIQVSYF
ncbi:hypothetical protein PGTUg99_009264 [Puccinia graminis f. sp. tritici]|uniref:Uncharacterized protein n=1 Tax=Puccinia graminis f. sp. tritici TaxID=56615 RepID=A0A5B0NW70_PUCGR|nr:hypothetical protein PGTUg99_009264 [Puccinia graminis f. sp. tritici]